VKFAARAESHTDRRGGGGEDEEEGRPGRPRRRSHGEAQRSGAMRAGRRRSWGAGWGSQVVGLGVPLLLGALALTGCESNIERSARLAKLAHHSMRVQTGLVVTRENPDVKVLATAVLHDENGTAAVVTLRNDSSKPLRDVPVAIALHGTRGETLYQNNVPGLSSALVSAPLLMPGQQFNWVDDQVQASGTLGALSVRVGEAPAAGGEPGGELPHINVQSVHLSEESASGPSAEGTVVNHSSVAQQELVVFAVGRRGGRIVAAGRAVLQNVSAHASASFQVFFIGSVAGARIEASAPPSTL
jgi:hypothetical protein